MAQQEKFRSAALASLRGRIGAHELHAQRDSAEITARARSAFQATFLSQVPADLPEPERLRRAESLKKAHFARLALASAKSRASRSDRSATRKRKAASSSPSADGQKEVADGPGALRKAV